MQFQLQDRVLVGNTGEGHSEGVVVGRIFCQPPLYDVRTPGGVLFYQPEDCLRKPESL